MAAPIRANDTPQDRLAKLLPADVTAAFLSAKAGIVTYLQNPILDAAPVFWTFVVILIICPVYFRYVSNIDNLLQNSFLTLSFIVYGVSIASSQFITYFSQFDLTDSTTILNILAIVLPILWVFLIAQIFISAMGQRVEN